MKLTLPLIRVQEIIKGSCTGCNLDDDDGKDDSTCMFIQNAHGHCTDNHCIYIVDTPEAIANYTKARIT